jgi:hypothetical protein
MLTLILTTEWRLTEVRVHIGTFDGGLLEKWGEQKKSCKKRKKRKIPPQRNFSTSRRPKKILASWKSPLDPHHFSNGPPLRRDRRSSPPWKHWKWHDWLRRSGGGGECLDYLVAVTGFAELHLCVVYILCPVPNSQTARLLNFEDRVRYGIVI